MRSRREDPDERNSVAGRIWFRIPESDFSEITEAAFVIGNPRVHGSTFGRDLRSGGMHLGDPISVFVNRLCNQVDIVRVGIGTHNQLGGTGFDSPKILVHSFVGALRNNGLLDKRICGRDTV